MESVSLYSEARNEYLKQMASWLSSPMVEFFRTEYQKISVKDSARAMSSFQAWCADVPKWNQDVIDAHVTTVLDTCRCDYVEELMTAVFIAHTKMLTAIRVSTRQKKMKITLPKLDHFLHRVFIECARGFWKAPFLFLESVPMIEKQKNVLQMETMCTEALSGAVRSLLPVKNILNEYLAEDEEDAEEEEAAPAPAPAPAPTPAKDTIKKSKPTLPLLTPVVEPTVEPVVEPIAIPIEVVPVVTKPAIPPSLVIQEDHSAPLPPVKDGITAMKIETEPAVHFTPYDTVFDETNDSVSEIRYTPKISVEDKPPSSWGLEDDSQDRIKLGTEESSISMSDIVDLDAPAAAPAPAPVAPPEDVEVPLASLGEFEELS
jgi:hypothetical protein